MLIHNRARPGEIREMCFNVLPPFTSGLTWVSFPRIQSWAVSTDFCHVGNNGEVSLVRRILSPKDIHDWHFWQGEEGNALEQSHLDCHLFACLMGEDVILWFSWNHFFLYEFWLRGQNSSPTPSEIAELLYTKPRSWLESFSWRAFWNRCLQIKSCHISVCACRVRPFLVADNRIDHLA